MPDTRAAAIGIANATIRGDTAAIAAALYDHDDDGFSALIRATLSLLRALGSWLRSPIGLMAIDARVAEISHQHCNRDTRIAARLILSHGMTCYPPVDTEVAAETFADFHDLGATTFNAACSEAGFRFVDVFITAMLLLRQLMPEADTYMVGIVAGQLWAEPAPPKPEGKPTTVIFRTKAEDSPPQPTLPRPLGTEIASGGPERRPYLPPGVPVNLAGLAELRRRQMYDD
jgi:hypothetical protein